MSYQISLTAGVWTLQPPPGGDPSLYRVNGYAVNKNIPTAEASHEMYLTGF